MDVAEDKPNDTPRAAKIGPGERLQSERIKKGLSVDDVASRMHLSTAILEAIEDNNFDEITAPIFVKGYLRAYARIVSLSEDEMIEQYLDMYSEEDPPISSTSSMVPELSVKDTSIKWTTYLVVLVLGVLLAAWWWNKQQNEEVPISLEAQTSELAKNSGDEVVVVDSEVQASSEASSVAADTAEVAEVIEQEAVTQESVVAETAADTAVAEQQPVETEATMEPEVEVADESGQEPGIEQESVSGNDSTSESESDTVDMAAAVESTDTADVQAESADAASGTRANPELSAPVGSDKLQIIVHADTWGDVKDANDYQMVYDLLRADTSLELVGEAPFAVFLGNGHGVEILFNGEEINVLPRIRDDNTARLKIGG